MQKILNLTKTVLIPEHFGSDFEVISLPKNLYTEMIGSFNRLDDYVENGDLDCLNEMVMVTCTELSIAASYFIVLNKDIPDDTSIQDLIEDWNNADDEAEEAYALSDANTKSKGIDILIDGPNFIMGQLQEDIHFLTNNLYCLHNNKMIPAILI